MMNLFSARHFSVRHWQNIIALGLVFWAMPLLAQIPADAELAKDKCLGYELEYKPYKRELVLQVQGDLQQLYQPLDDYQVDFNSKGNPLSDGYLGPITWSWMQRFCKNFAIKGADFVAEALPPRLQALANFSKTNREASEIFISQPFVLWALAHPQACDLDTRAVLRSGSDAQLLALLECYQKPIDESPAKPATPVADYKPNSLYVLRADDFDAMKETSALIKQLQPLIDQAFTDRPSANAAIAKALKKLSPEQAQTTASALDAALQTRESYMLTDEVLNQLYQNGIGDALFAQLQALPDKNYSEKNSLEKALAKAIDLAQTSIDQAAKPETTSTSTPATSTTAASAQASSTSSQTSADNQSQSTTQEQPITKPQPPLNKAALLLQIQLASRLQTWVLTREAMEQALHEPLPLPPEIIHLLRGLQDLEYPEGELLHLAIQNKLIKGLGLCRLDKSNTMDRHIQLLDEKAKQALDEQLKQLLPASMASAHSNKLCSEDSYAAMSEDYNHSLRQLIEGIYREDMPAYQPQPIQWDGGDCGCVPHETATIAYGIYPYWKTADQVQTYDFSTFSRVAYFGLSANDAGQLLQINATSQLTSLVNNNSSGFKAFIESARRYGGKVDWVIQKDWSQYSDEDSNPKDAQLQSFFTNLKINLLKFIATELTSPQAKLSPILSLGASDHPINGDGITLYFTNYPKTDSAQKAFNEFFSQLKSELDALDNSRNSSHSIKHHTFLNLLINQADFTGDSGVFRYGNILHLFKMQKYTNENLSIVDMQEQAHSLAILLMAPPYYSSLDEIYAITSSKARNLIVPMMINDYTNISDTSDTGTDGNPYAIDERTKELSYIHESFGGGGFWPITPTGLKEYAYFDKYIGDNFAPGFDESLWTSKLCVYRWELISLMNLWLILALVYLLFVFYIFPHQCRHLPSLLSWLPHPLTVLAVLVPPLCLWIYLLIEDPVFKLFTYSSLLSLVIIGLTARAAINAVKVLRQPIPNRNLLAHQKQPAPTPGRGAKNDTNSSE